ncbi:glycosyltransferase family 2 protein [Mesorhizobium sp. B1-1-8]|uniref:glycosyltransferase family 2 protein n=1 Tax=Mesorhizobium sp. B1-1-8 TaxID=2589976 RepID=UPI00112E180B|nr:glycosyltransferase [Mesorhizobium sp. B1-1-8]UCI10740.1 glycosyltransferase [Mesorhizobium sp. B1-1-8]
MPQVSIIIPVHNQPLLVLEAVDSLRVQSIGDWEAILVDDGSTDETPMVLQKLAAQDARISLLVQTNKGAAAARNLGAANAKADWLLFLDSDDWLAPRAVESLICAAGENIDLVHALGLRVCGPNSQSRSQVQLPPKDDLFHRLTWTATFMVHACLLRRSTFQELGGFDETLMGCADWDLWQRVVRSGARYAGVDEIVAFYRQTESSLSTNYGQELRDGLVVIDRGHGRDPRVVRPYPAYAEGAQRSAFSPAAYRFATWLGGLAIARNHPIEGILRGIQSIPAERLSAGDIAATLLDAIPIGLGDFRPDWEACWPTLRPQLSKFLEKLGDTTRSGQDFVRETLLATERLAAIANASDDGACVGAMASRVVRIPGSIPHLDLGPNVTSFIAVVRTDRTELGQLEAVVDPTFSGGKVREIVVEHYPRAVFSAYFKRFPASLIFGMIIHVTDWKNLLLSLANFVGSGSIAPSLRRQIAQALLAQSFVLPVLDTTLIQRNT